MLHKCRAQLGFALILLLQVQLLPQPAQARCNRPDDLANGTILQRRNFLRFRCFFNYMLMGQSMLSCGINGRLSGERPFCARAGCSVPPSPDNGTIEVQRGLAAVIMCQEEFVVAGNGLAYCNGNKWDRTLGVCRHRNHSQSHACDFESEDLCGWVPQVALIQPWRRVATVSHFHTYRTGPRHDHTLQNAYGGHYMLMETTPYAVGNHYMISPIYPRALSLKTACCFRFHYFMYGADVGALVVSVKPSDLSVERMSQQFGTKYQKFKINGNQGNQWLEHTIIIDEMPQDFQVVFTATDASAQFGDIAIDDVRLMTGSECGGGIFTTTTEQPVRETAEPVVYETMSCSDRCGQSAPLYDELRHDGTLIKSCSCEDLCMVMDNCCLDYIEHCVINLYNLDEEPALTNQTTTAQPTTRTSKAATATTTRTTTTTPRSLYTSKATTTTVTPTTTTRRIPSTTTPTTTTKATTTKSTTTNTTTTTKKADTTTTTTTSRPNSTVTTPTAAATTTTTPNTTTTATTRATPTTTTAAVINVPTQQHRKRISWPVAPDDIKGDADRSSGSGPVRIMLYLMMAIVLGIVVSSVVYRWRRPKGAINEKTVSFKNTYDRLKKAAVFRVQRRRRNEANSPFLAEIENAEDNADVQFEEMGVDIRNVSEL